MMLLEVFLEHADQGGEREERERRLHEIEVRSQAMKNKLTGKVCSLK